MTVQPHRVRRKLEYLAELRKLASERWWNDPVQWVEDCVDFGDGPGLASYQKRAMRSLAEHHRLAKRAPRGAGKTMPAALVFWWFAATREMARAEWKIPTTAGSWPQITLYLWPEIHKWEKRIRWHKMGLEPPKPRSQLMQHHLKWNHGEAFGRAVTDPKLIEGAHADNVLMIIDEGKSVVDAVWDAVEGFFSTPGDHYVLALSTPGAPIGRFYDICSRQPGLENWHPMQVTVEEAISEGRISREWQENLARLWGVDSVMYRCHVLAEFAGEEDGVIPLGWVEAAFDRYKLMKREGTFPKKLYPRVIAMDVADTGDDDTVLGMRDGNIVYHIERFKEGSVLDHADKIKSRSIRRSEVVIDSIGIGAGTFAAAKREGLNATGFVASERSKRKDRTGKLGFANKRAEGWWHLRELLDPELGDELAFVDDPKLLGDLAAPKWKEVAGAKVLIESKDEIRKRLGRSTDTGDMVVMLFAPTDSAWEFG